MYPALKGSNSYNHMQYFKKKRLTVLDKMTNNFHFNLYIELLTRITLYVREKEIEFNFAVCSIFFLLLLIPSPRLKFFLFDGQMGDVPLDLENTLFGFGYGLTYDELKSNR